jgi:hypothetical protein
VVVIPALVLNNLRRVPLTGYGKLVGLEFPRTRFTDPQAPLEPSPALPTGAELEEAAHVPDALLPQFSSDLHAVRNHATVRAGSGQRRRRRA